MAAALAAIIILIVIVGSGAEGEEGDGAGIAPPRREVIAAVLASDPSGASLSSEAALSGARDRLGAARVFAAEAAERDLTIRQELVDEQVALIARACCGGDQDGLQRWLSEKGTNLAALRTVIGTQLEADLLRASIVASASPVRDERQLRQAYRARRQLLARPASREILLARLADRSSAEALRERLLTAEAQGDREELIRAASVDPSAPGGGLVVLTRPRAGQPDPDPALTARAFSLSTDGVSRPFRSAASGWLVIVARDDVIPPRTPSFPQARKALSEQLQAEAGQRAWARHVRELTEAGRFEGITPPVVSRLVPDAVPGTVRPPARPAS